MYEATLRWHGMRNKAEVRRRAKILVFWSVHGLEATVDAFGVSRRTLFRWQKALNEGRGRLTSLDPKSTAPKNRRKRIYDPVYLEQVISLRKKHPRLGKKKLAVLCGVSESYAGRTLTDLKERGLIPQRTPLSLHAKSGELHERKHKKQAKKRRKAKQGMEVDTVVRFIHGTKRYIYTAIDVERRFAFAGAYTGHSSANAVDFLLKLTTVTPFPLREIQTDNGSEFARHFKEACAKANIVHYHTYPRSPKMNAYVERFNRTLSEDFIQRHRGLLAADINLFNERLVDWLLWYNAERPHQSLGMLSPLQYIVRDLTEEECQRWWTST